MSKFLIQYPSGENLELEGNFQHLKINDEIGKVPAIDEISSQIVILDPRAVIRNSDTQAVVYSPRWFQDELAPWANDWLNENPQWGEEEACQTQQ